MARNVSKLLILLLILAPKLALGQFCNPNGNPDDKCLITEYIDFTEVGLPTNLPYPNHYFLFIDNDELNLFDDAGNIISVGTAKGYEDQGVQLIPSDGFLVVDAEFAYVRASGDGGPVDIGDDLVDPTYIPEIGEVIRIEGLSDTNTVRLSTRGNIVLNGDAVLYSGFFIELMYTGSVYKEIMRSF